MAPTYQKNEHGGNMSIPEPSFIYIGPHCMPLQGSLDLPTNEQEAKKAEKAAKVKQVSTSFRISARKLFLTYSQVPQAMTHQEVLESLKKVVDFGDYAIGREKHAISQAVSQTEGQDQYHYHVLLTARTKFNIKTPTLLDLRYKEITLHGKYEAVKSFKKGVEYVCKDKNYQTNI